MYRRLLYFQTIIFIFSMWSCAKQITESADTIFPGDGSTKQINARFSSIQDSVFSPQCAISGCHDGSIKPQLSAGFAYSQIVNIPNGENRGADRIEPGNPEKSYLYLKLIGKNITGSRMPLGAPPLSQSVIDSIQAWIENGAFQN